MLLRHWTTLVFSLWAWGVGHSQQDLGSESRCHITSDRDSQYVAAYVMHYRPGRGCYSNSSSPSHQLVHVINLKFKDPNDDDKRRPVSLKIEPKDFSSNDVAEKDKKSLEVHQRVLVFVLNSDKAVKWKVEVSGKFQSHALQLFLVPKESTIRFKKRKARAHMRGRRRNMPKADDERSFLLWVKKKFKAVTSYSEVVDGNKLLFYVGQAEASSECRLNDMKPSPYAMIAHMEKQPVSGCTSVGRKIVLDRPVYIIELQGVPEGHTKSKQRVELDIISASGKKMELKFYLILRSPEYVKWVLTSHRIQGRIDVLTDADADVRGIRMHTVALRREVIELSGSDLIRWAEYYTAPVRAYASVTSANFLQLRLPYNDSDSLTLWNKDPVMPPQNPGQGLGRGGKPEGNLDDLKEQICRLIKTRCEGGMMEVAFPTALTQARGIEVAEDRLSLLDRHCRATKNRTHVILRTALDKCKTSKMTIDDEVVYSNSIMMPASGVLGDILEEELGSGFFDLQATSGSGWMESDGDGSDTPYVDDEDYASRLVELDVECRVPWSASSGMDQGTDGANYHEALSPDTCELQLYDDPRLRPQHRVTQFPHTASSSTGIYIQASAPNKQLHVLMEYCWVTRWKDPQVPDDQQVILVQQGCTRSPGTNWVPYETGHRGNQGIPPECLMIYRHLPQGSHVHCQLSVCYKGSLAPGQKCPPDPSDHCNSNILPNTFPKVPMRSCGVHSVGPLEVTDGEFRIVGEPIPTRTTKPINTDNGGSRAFKTDNGPQQSVIIEGLDSGAVVGIAFAAFAIGIVLTGGLWFIHTHTGPSKRGMTAVSGTSGDVTPNSSSPIST